MFRWKVYSKTEKSTKNHKNYIQSLLSAHHKNTVLFAKIGDDIFVVKLKICYSVYEKRAAPVKSREACILLDYISES